MTKKKLFYLVLVLVIIVLSGIFINKIMLHENSKEQKQESDIDMTEESNANAEIIEKKEATYEKWLAAAMVVAVSLEEEEFEIEHIYFYSENSLNDLEKSEGVYLIYESSGNTICLYSSPLAEERKEKGLKNLYTKDLGFATFDYVDENTKDFSDWREIQVEELEELILQSMLVSIYEN